MKYKKQDVIECLKHSNWIEEEYSEKALEDSIKAWNFAYKNRNKIDVNYILTIHDILLQRINPRIAGHLRQCDVWIGGQCKKFIATSLLKESLQEIVDIMNRYNINFGGINQCSLYKENIMKEKWAKSTHILFEQGHVFEDGNGRVGRILYNIHRLRLELPIHIIDSYQKHTLYYPWFQ